MRALLAAFLACMVVVMTASDRLVCPDGCTDEAPVQTLTPHASAPCALCQAWNHSPVVVAPRPVLQAITRVPIPTVRLVALALPPIELPPRVA